MNKLLKIFGFKRCLFCNKLVHKWFATIGRFCDDPDEGWGYLAWLCKRCDDYDN